jgi:hypothetical protein
MGIGPQAVETYKILREKGVLAGLNSVIELGSQDIPDNEWHQKYAKHFLSSITSKPPKLGAITSKEFHADLGFCEYQCIDSDGKHDALTFDLNLDLKEAYGFDKTFDLVTNHGTSEHVFNQYQCFKNTHKLMRVGGLALHAVPFEGYLNHGYFNYQPAFFLDLAIANNYELVGIWYYAQRNTHWLRRWTQYIGNTVPIPWSNNLLSVLDELCVAGKFPSSPLNNESIITVVFRKTSDGVFKSPFDARFSQVSQLKESYGSILMSQRDQNVSKENHFKDIKKYMGQHRFLARLRRGLSDPDYRKFLRQRVRNLLRL